MGGKVTKRLRQPWCVAAAVVACGWLVVAVAQPANAQDLWTRPSLSGDWSGWRPWLAEHGIDPAASYIGDVVANVHGGVRRRAEYLGSFDLTLNANLDELTGLEAGTVFIHGLATVGADPSRNVGDAQGVDSLAAPSTARLYEAWWQRAFFNEHLLLLAGLYDVNSEFDVIDSAAVFVHSSFGMGAEFGHSGVNGPSVFPPTTSLGVRVRVTPAGPLVVQAAVLDGVPGDPDQPYGTHVRLREDDGLLVVTEAALVWEGAPPDTESSPEKSHRHHGIGRGWRVPRHALKLALGAWVYTSRLQNLADVDADGRPVMQHGDPGFYLLADAEVYREPDSSTQGLSLFARVGIADAQVQQFGGFAGAGLVYTGLIPARDVDPAGIGVVAVINGSGFKSASAAAGVAPSDAEVELELTYRAAVTPWLSLQPDLQYVIDPGGTTQYGDAVVIGLRSEITF